MKPILNDSFMLKPTHFDIQNPQDTNRASAINSQVSIDSQLHTAKFEMSQHNAESSFGPANLPSRKK